MSSLDIVSTKSKTALLDTFSEHEIVMPCASNDSNVETPHIRKTWKDIETGDSNTSQIEDPADYPDGGCKAYSVLLGAFLGLTVDFGTVNSTGSIQSYLNLHQLADVSTKTSSMIFAIFLFLTYVTGVFSGALFDVLGPRIPLMIGTTLTFFGLFFTGNCTNAGSFMGILGVLAGIGIGMLASPLTGVISHWFFRKRSLAFGVATLGGSVGGIAFPMMLNALYGKVGFTWALRTYGLLCLGLMAASIALVTGRRDQLPRPPKVAHIGETKWQHFKRLTNKAVDFSALKSLDFLLCTLAISLSDLSLVCTLTYFPSFVTSIGFTETQANTSLTIMNAMGIAGRFIPGYIADRIGCFNVMTVMMTMTSLSVLCLWLGWALSSQSITSIWVFSIVYGFFNSSVLSLCPSCIAAISPTRDFGKRYGTAYCITGIFVLCGMLIGGVILDSETLSSYRYFALYCGLCNAASMAAFFLSRCCQVGLKFKARV